MALAVTIASAAVGCKAAEVTVGSLPAPSPLTVACGAVPTVLAHVAAVQPRRMAMDEGNVYVIAAATSGALGLQDLWRVPKTGAPPQRIAEDQPWIADIDVGVPANARGDGTVYWTSGAADADVQPASGVVWRMPPDPGNVVSPLAPNRPAPGALLVAGDRVFWAERAIDQTGRPFGAIVSTSIDGGPVETLQRLDAQLVPRTLDWLRLGDGSSHMLCWTTFDPAGGDAAAGEVSGCSLSSPLGAITPFVGPDAGGAGAIETSGIDHLFYSGREGIAEVVVPIDGGAPSTDRLFPTGGFVERIEEDGASVYFVDPSTGRLLAWDFAKADGRAPRQVVPHVDPASAFQVDTSCAYWIDASTQTVMTVRTVPPASNN